MTQRRVLIVPALPVEAKAILSFFEDLHVKSAPNGASYVTGNRKIFSTRLGERIREHWSFFIATPSGAGNVEVSRVAHQMIPECDPHLVALIGCAGGFPNKIELYDVVVAPRVDYLARAKIGGRTQLRPQQEPCSNVFIDHCKNVQLLDLWHQYLLPDVLNAPINVYFEPIISSETVLANSHSAFFRSAIASSPKAVAIEMEGYGFLAACREHKVEAAVLRGISDTLDDKSGGNTGNAAAPPGLDRAQFKATRHAAALFFATLDFVNVGVFSRTTGKAKTEVTEVSMILDAEMHDVTEIQADLFELFKKYGIRNFSFKPANSVRVGFQAHGDAMRIYKALVAAGIVEAFAGFKVLDFKVRDDGAGDAQLKDILARIDRLRGASVDEVLQIMRAEGWMERLPAHAAIVLDALEHQKAQGQKARRKTGGRILYPVAEDNSQPGQMAKYIGLSAAPAVTLTDTRGLRQRLERWQPQPARSELLSWIMGNSLVDRDIGLDVLLAYSKQKFFYAWPGLGSLYAACNISEKAFVDGCVAEWEARHPASGPTLLQLLDQDASNRLSRGQIRDAMLGRPATLSKCIEILAVTSRILSQNQLPVHGCIIPSLYALTFNGVIAGDGAVERMLLTGMAGDLAEVARRTELPLLAIQSAIRGDTLPYRAAEAVAAALDRAILRNTRLTVSAGVLDPDQADYRRREAITLNGKAPDLYLAP